MAFLEYMPGEYACRKVTPGAGYLCAACGYIPEGRRSVQTAAADGYVWEIPAGPMTIRCTAVIKEGAWQEVGDRIMPGKEPIRFFEMNLKRVGDTSWPAAGAVGPQ